MKKNILYSQQTRQPKLIILGAFWDDIIWLKPALEQLLELLPDEILISEGCFDPNQEVQSKDGTYQELLRFAQRDSRVKLFSPIRAKTRLHSIYLLLKYPYFTIKPSRLLAIFFSLRKSIYRVNQAITFNYMISRSQYWKEGNWFMTYDSDQFYEDSVLDIIRNRTYMNNQYSQLQAREITFFNSFTRYTTNYEKRLWSNMPHKINSKTVIRPTRDIFIESFFINYSYYKTVDTKFVGNYFHYKILSPRLLKGYSLGDREAPQFPSFHYKRWSGPHQRIIVKYLSYLRKELRMGLTAVGSKSKTPSSRKNK